MVGNTAIGASSKSILDAISTHPSARSGWRQLQIMKVCRLVSKLQKQKRKEKQCANYCQGKALEKLVYGGIQSW